MSCWLTRAKIEAVLSQYSRLLLAESKKLYGDFIGHFNFLLQLFLFYFPIYKAKRPLVLLKSHGGLASPPVLLWFGAGLNLDLSPDLPPDEPANKIFLAAPALQKV